MKLTVICAIECSESGSPWVLGPWSPGPLFIPTRETLPLEMQAY